MQLINLRDYLSSLNDLGAGAGGETRLGPGAAAVDRRVRVSRGGKQSKI